MMRRNRSDAIIHFAGTALSEENQMSIFPTTILLATDGSSEAQSATQTAVDLGQKQTRSCTWSTSWTSPQATSFTQMP
jgi:hypothetical protein